jgi:L-malate glycosyltransferase
MKILHATTFLNGGAGRVLMDLATLQKHKGHEVYVVANKTEYEGYFHYKEYLQAMKEHKIKVLLYDSLFIREKRLNQNAIRGISNYFNRYECFDVIHAHASIPAYVTKKALIQNKDMLVIQTMHGWGSNKTPLMEKQDVKIMNSLNHVVALTKSDKIYLISKGVKQSKIKIIPNGIKKEQSKKKLPRKISDFIRHKWDFKILCIGEIGERKNQKFLVETINKAYQLGHRFCIVLVGPEEKPGYYEENIEKLCDKELLLRTGEVKEASKFISHFDCLILPSKSEGMPITILEAFREKTLVMGSDIPGIKDVIKNNKNGFIFKLKKNNDLLKILINLDEDTKINVIKSARKEFLEKYTIENAAEKYQKIYISQA